MNNTCGKKAFAAGGLSMFPFILPGSCLVVGRVDPKTVKVGDVVCYPSENGRMIAHRVVDIHNQNTTRHVYIKGDSSVTREEIPLSAMAYLVYRVEHPFLSYDTDRLFGRGIAKIATSSITLSRGYRFTLHTVILLSKKLTAIKRILSTQIR